MTVVVLVKRFGQWLPDSLYLKIIFRMEMGYRLNLRNPKTFSEKLQWLKLYNQRPEYTMMVDKYAVKDYVERLIGKEFIIPTFGVWDRPEDIEWDKLPSRFVLKTTNGSGSEGVVICTDKSHFDQQKAIEKLRRSYRGNVFHSLREWPYKNVSHRIIAEQYIEPAPNVKDLPDYKWYCFNGDPKYCQVIQNRTTHETIDFFDTNWVHQEFVGLNPVKSPVYGRSSVVPAPPKNLEVQIRIAKELSKDLPFSRIDLYESREHTYFGEITFFPASGFGVFNPEKYNESLGAMIILPNFKHKG